MRSCHTAGETKRQRKPLGGDFFGQYGGGPRSPDTSSLELYSPVRSPVTTPHKKKRPKGAASVLPIAQTITRELTRAQSLPGHASDGSQISGRLRIELPAAHTPEPTYDTSLSMDIPTHRKNFSACSVPIGLSVGVDGNVVDVSTGELSDGDCEGSHILSPLKSQMSLDRTL